MWDTNTIRVVYQTSQCTSCSFRWTCLTIRLMATWFSPPTTHCNSQQLKNINRYQASLQQFYLKAQISHTLILQWSLTCAQITQHKINRYKTINEWLPRNATQSAVMPQYIVCPSVTLKHVFHTGWNSSKIISRRISLGSLLLGAPTSAIWFNGNTSTIGEGFSVRIFHRLIF